MSNLGRGSLDDASQQTFKVYVASDRKCLKFFLYKPCKIIAANLGKGQNTNYLRYRPYGSVDDDV